MNIKRLIEEHGYNNFSLEDHEKVLVKNGSDFSQVLSLNFLGKEVGYLRLDNLGTQGSELAATFAPLLMMQSKIKNWHYISELFNWINGAKGLVPEVTDWVGIYYKASSFWEEDSTDLILGPFRGEATEHQRIPLDKGLCGLALREERVVNIDDVHKEQEHIACSLKTNSELIIPLLNGNSEMVAELDIDCNKLGAFTPEVEEKFKIYASTFRFWK